MFDVTAETTPPTKDSSEQEVASRAGLWGSATHHRRVRHVFGLTGPLAPPSPVAVSLLPPDRGCRRSHHRSRSAPPESSNPGPPAGPRHPRHRSSLTSLGFISTPLTWQGSKRPSRGRRPAPTGAARPAGHVTKPADATRASGRPRTSTQGPTATPGSKVYAVLSPWQPRDAEEASSAVGGPLSPLSNRKNKPAAAQWSAPRLQGEQNQTAATGNWTDSPEPPGDGFSGASFSVDDSEDDAATGGRSFNQSHSQQLPNAVEGGERSLGFSSEPPLTESLTDAGSQTWTGHDTSSGGQTPPLSSVLHVFRATSSPSSLTAPLSASEASNLHRDFEATSLLSLFSSGPESQTAALPADGSTNPWPGAVHPLGPIHATQSDRSAGNLPSLSELDPSLVLWSAPQFLLDPDQRCTSSMSQPVSQSDTGFASTWAPSPLQAKAGAAPLQPAHHPDGLSLPAASDGTKPFEDVTETTAAEEAAAEEPRDGPPALTFDPVLSHTAARPPSDYAPTSSLSQAQLHTSPQRASGPTPTRTEQPRHTRRAEGSAPPSSPSPSVSGQLLKALTGSGGEQSAPAEAPVEQPPAPGSKQQVSAPSSSPGSRPLVSAEPSESDAEASAAPASSRLSGAGDDSRLFHPADMLPKLHAAGNVSVAQNLSTQAVLSVPEPLHLPGLVPSAASGAAIDALGQHVASGPAVSPTASTAGSDATTVTAGRARPPAAGTTAAVEPKDSQQDVGISKSSGPSVSNHSTSPSSGANEATAPPVTEPTAPEVAPRHRPCGNSTCQHVETIPNQRSHMCEVLKSEFQTTRPWFWYQRAAVAFGFCHKTVCSCSSGGF